MEKTHVRGQRSGFSIGKATIALIATLAHFGGLPHPFERAGPRPAPAALRNRL